MTDNIRLFGFMNYSFDYEIEATNVADGLDSVVRAPLGVILRQQWRASSAENGQSTLTERVSIEASVFVMFTVTGNMDSSHKELREKIAALAEQQ